MRPDELDKDAAELERHMYDQPIFVAANIEDSDAIAARHRHGVRVRIDTPHVLKAAPFRFTNDLIPLLQRLACVRIPLGKLAKPFARDDSHVRLMVTLCKH